MTSARYSVESTVEAEGDLEAIHAYIADTRSLGQADDLIAKMSEVMAKLEQFPLRGAVPKELGALARKRYRQVHLAPYRLFYRVVDTRVVISLIVDGRRDLPELLARRLLRR